MTEVGKCTRTIETAEGQITVYSLRELEEKGIIKDLSKMPYSIKVIVESMLRQRDGRIITGVGMGAALEFGLALVEVFCGKETAEHLGDSVLAK